MSETISELRYLDDILSYLKTCSKNSSTLLRIFNSLYNENYTEDGDTVATIHIQGDSFTVDYTGSNNYKMSKLCIALTYLINEKLLIQGKTNSEVQLSFAGIIKTTSTFVDNYIKENKEQRLKISLSKFQRLGVVIAIIVGISGVVFSIYKIYEDNKSSCKCIVKPQNTIKNRDNN
jgi:hypothetical protein